MKTFNKNKEFLVFQKFSGALFFLSFLLFVPRSVSKTSNFEAAFFEKNSLPLGFAKNAKTDTEQEGATSTSSSFFVNLLAGVGSFFSAIGRGIGKGITSTVLFLGQVIVFPVTATLYLFSRSETGTSKNGNSGG